MKSNSAIDWLHKIFNIQTISTLAGIIAACIAILEYVEDNEGSIIALVNNKESYTPIERNVLVYLDQETMDLKQLNLLPQILNPSKYAVKDIYVKYAIKSHNANIDYTDYYSIHRVADKTELDIKEKTLYPQTELPEAFNTITLKNNSSIEINLRTTYQGAEQPYEYDARIAAKRIWNKNDDQRKKLILADAYQYASTKALKSVDIYIMKGEFANIMTNVSLDQLQDLNTATNQLTNPQIQTSTSIETQAKSVSTICKESKDTIQTIKDNTSTPWYVWVIGVVLFLLMSVAFLGLAFGIVTVLSEDETLKGRYQALLGAIISLIIVYICWYFFMMCINNAEPVKFIAGFVCYLMIIVTVGFHFYLMQKIANKFRLKEDSFVKDMTAVALFVFLCSVLVVLMCYLYNLIPI